MSTAGFLLEFVGKDAAPNASSISKGASSRVGVFPMIN